MKNKNFNKAYISTLLWFNQADQENKSILERRKVTDLFKNFKIRNSVHEISIIRLSDYKSSVT